MACMMPANGYNPIPTGNDGTTNITVPFGASPGQTGMRVRSRPPAIPTALPTPVLTSVQAVAKLYGDHRQLHADHPVFTPGRLQPV